MFVISGVKLEIKFDYLKSSGSFEELHVQPQYEFWGFEILIGDWNKSLFTSLNSNCD